MIYDKIGEIVKNHIYIREIHSSHNEDSEKHLIVSKSLYEKLSKVYDFLGLKPSSCEIKANIQLPSNSKSHLRREWNTIKLKTSIENPQLTFIDSLARYYKKEVVLASDKWLCKYESIPGDPIVISPHMPVPDKAMIISRCAR